ncbi:MAG: HAD family hydrolase, partial [Terriglobia bacterium]
QAILPTIFAGAREMVEADRAQGARVVLVTGEADFALGPVMSYFGFDGLIANSLVFHDGVATGAVVSPLIAEESKVKAMVSLCQRYDADIRRAKAYSDSFSDVPMLEAVGYPCAVNPDRRLRKKAEARGWPIRDLSKSAGPRTRAKQGNHVHIS